MFYMENDAKLTRLSSIVHNLTNPVMATSVNAVALKEELARITALFERLQSEVRACAESDSSIPLEVLKLLLDSQLALRRCDELVEDFVEGADRTCSLTTELRQFTRQL
ncbi:MAG: hypothetical protein MJE77_48115 [Proteobacteria bacterium]|nr:hypothetical protein [Pseudomonadota bacterium]